MKAEWGRLGSGEIGWVEGTRLDIVVGFSPTVSSPAEWRSYVSSTKGRAEPQGPEQTIRSRGT